MGDFKCQELECDETVSTSNITEEQSRSGVGVFCDGCGATYWVEAGKKPVCVDTPYPSVFGGTMY